MKKVLRRQVLVGAVAAPIAVLAPPSQADPTVEAVCSWLSARLAADQLSLRWQQLESRLIKRGKPLSLTRALRSGLPEARELRALTRKINAAERKLEVSAARIAKMRATSGEGALAKIEMGLKIQCPQDCEEMAWALVKGGADELRALMGASR